MIGMISGKLKAAPLVDPNRYGRSDRRRSAAGSGRSTGVLLLLVAVLIAIGLIAVAAASPAAAQRYSGGSVTFSGLYYFYRQLAWIALGIPVMIGISMLPRDTGAAAVAVRRGLLFRAADLRSGDRAGDQRRQALDRGRLHASSSRRNS